MTEFKITTEVLNSLGAKLEDLALTDSERAVLDTVLQRAESVGDEVEGFGVVFEVEPTFKGTDEELQPTAAGSRLRGPLGFHIHVNPYVGETEKNAR